MFNKFFTETAIFAILPQLPKILNLFILPFLMDHLDTKDFGIYGLVLAYMGATAFFKDLGLYNSFFTSFYNYKYRYKIVWSKIFGILTIWSLPYTVIVGFILFFFLSSMEIESMSLLLFVLLFPLLVFENTILIGNVKYRLDFKITQIAIITSISSVVSVGLSYVLIVEYGLGYLGWFYSMFVSSAINFICFSYVVFVKEKIFPIFKIKIRTLKAFLKISLPFIPHNYSSYLVTTSDRLVLNFYKVDINEIGLYNFSYQFPHYFSVIDHAIGMVAFPYYMENYSKKNHTNNKILFVILSKLLLVGTFTICLWFKEIILIFTNEAQYETAYIFSIIILMSFNYRPFYMASTWHLFQEENSKMLLKISFFAGIINVSLNLIFIPFFGIKAAAIITFISYIYLGFSGFLIKGNVLPIKYDFKRYFLIIISSTLFVYLIRDISVNYKLTLTLILIFYLYLTIKNFIKKNNDK